MKPRRNITLGEMQDECKKHRGCIDCPYEVWCGADSPDKWDLTDPPRFTQKQMAFLKSWYDIGAITAYHGAYDETVEFASSEITIGTVMDESIVRLIPHGEGINLADLFGREAK